MTDDEAWQCADCGTIIDDTEMRTCRNCGGINFYPIADEVPGAERGEETVELDLDRALDRLSEDDS